MLQIGCGWQKINPENGNNSVSIAINKEILKLYPQLDNMFLNLYENKNKKEDKQPDYFLYLSLPDEDKAAKSF